MKNLPITVVHGIPEIPGNVLPNQFNSKEMMVENPHRDLKKPKEGKWISPKKAK
jgi:hypothetical protein